MNRKPSSNMFVVIGKKDKLQKREVMPKGETTELKGMDALLLEIEGKNSDPKSNWKKVIKENDESVIHPVLIDEDGISHYPDGRISVRFYDKVSDADLEKFGKRHGLAAPTRNPYVPEQVTFQLNDPHKDYIVDVVDDVAKEEKVRTAWANTFAQFKRG